MHFLRRLIYPSIAFCAGAGAVVVLLVPALLWNGARDGSQAFWMGALGLSAVVVAGATAMAIRREMADRSHPNTDRELIGIMEDELGCLSRDVHDSLCQLLSSASLRVRALRDFGAVCAEDAASLSEVQRILDSGTREAYALMYRLAPLSSSELSLPQALRDLAHQANMRGLAKCSYRGDEQDQAGLSRAQVAQLHHIAVDAVAFAIQHAKANSVLIMYDTEGTRAQLVIEDDGIETDASAESKPGLAMSTISRRAALAGATFSVKRSKESNAIQCRVQRT